MKKKLLILALLLACSCSNVAKYKQYDAFSSYHVIDVAGESFNLSVTTLDLDWVSGSVNILVDDTYQGVTIFEEYVSGGDVLSIQDEYKCYLFHDENTLNVKYCASDSILPNTLTKNLKVCIPSSINLETIKINNVSSVLSIGEVYCDTLDISNASGNVTINKTATKSIKYNGASGSLSLLASLLTENIEIKQSTGNTILSLPSTVSGFMLEWDSQSGSIVSDFACRVYKNIYSYLDSTYLNIKVESSTGGLGVVSYTTEEAPVGRSYEE